MRIKKQRLEVVRLRGVHPSVSLQYCVQRSTEQRAGTDRHVWAAGTRGALRPLPGARWAALTCVCSGAGAGGGEGAA
jgi:hypothetical protein